MPSPSATPIAQSTASATRCAPIVGADVRAALLGRYRPEMKVVRQAFRVTDTDTDEMIVVQARHEWWIGRRIDETITVWGCQSQLQAEEIYDALIGDVVDRGQWHQARARSAA